jgi:pyrroloquinoline quinone biosynthesis protein B
VRTAARTQSQVACSADGRRFFLLNASPDLRAQIEAAPDLHPRESPRSTPIAGVVLTNADLDHVLGLLLLREFQPLRIYSTAAVRKILTEDNSVFGMLRQFREQLQWQEIVPGQPFELTAVDGTRSGLVCEPVAVPWGYPAYVSPERKASLPADEAVLGLVVRAADSGRRLAFFPGLSRVTDDWLTRVAECDALLVDGTFWSDDELVKTRGTGRTAREMGHVPLSGPDGSLARLSGVTRPRRIYTHINNTNPILDEDSPEHRAVREAGWEIGHDGLEIPL